MANIKINRKNNTIEITKTFDKAASKFGSEEYNLLKDARNDNPGFRVVVKTSKQKRDSTKGLDYKYMEAYIKKHDDENGTIMEEFLTMRGKIDDDFTVGSRSYGEIKKWFLNTYPEIEKFEKKRDELLNKKSA